MGGRGCRDSPGLARRRRRRLCHTFIRSCTTLTVCPLRIRDLAKETVWKIAGLAKTSRRLTGPSGRQEDVRT
jgi:hypothetical protein